MHISENLKAYFYKNNLRFHLFSGSYQAVLLCGLVRNFTVRYTQLFLGLKPLPSLKTFT